MNLPEQVLRFINNGDMNAGTDVEVKEAVYQIMLVGDWLRNLKGYDLATNELARLENSFRSICHARNLKL